VKRRIIVPFFISHLGCPHQCVFCDQRAITGSVGRLPAANEILATIDAWGKSAGNDTVDVAFYGGSFTALAEELQKQLLSPLQPLLASGEVGSIRVSTRPDAVSDEVARFLRDSGVDLVELGVQSMHDEVLSRAGRGHLAKHTEEAFAALRTAGLKVGAQLMPGLPGDTPSLAVESLSLLLPLKPDLLRIYPAVVLRNTELARLYESGRYRPLSLDEAVAVCKVMLQVAASAGIPVIRVGLHPTDELTAGGEVLAGPYHPAFRQLAEAERWYDLLRILCADLAPGEKVTFQVAPARVSDVIGQNRHNIRRLEKLFHLHVSGVDSNAAMGGDEIIIKLDNRMINGNITNMLQYHN